MSEFRHITFLVLFFLSNFLLVFAEEITITTYYPSPYGSYNQLQTYSLGVGDNNGTNGLDDGDVPTAQGDVWINGNVGIGIGANNPNARLQINGAISRQGTTLNGSIADIATQVNLGVNSITGNRYSTVSGGYRNTATGSVSTVLGGTDNTATGSVSTVLGGGDNEASDTYSTVLGGYDNLANGYYSTVSGGTGNTATGYASIVSCGYNNIAAGEASWAGGRNMQVNADRSFAWGYSATAVNINTADVFIIYSSNVGIGTTNPGGDRLDVRGRAYASGGWQTTDADYAEWFEKEEDANPGDIIGINLLTGKARRYNLGDRFIGICSHNSGVVGNRLKETDKEMKVSHILVGLLGQLDFDRSQVDIEGRVIKTKDGKEIGILLSNGNALVGK